MPRPLDAVPPYFGGRRRVVSKLFAALSTVLPETKWPQATFVDAFLGGGTLSLYAKIRGFRVLCNDIALRSIIVGKALIENGTRRITGQICVVRA